MKLTKEEVTAEINNLISEGEKVLETEWSPSSMGVISFNTYVDMSKYSGWHTKILNFLNLFLPSESEYIIELKSRKENHLSYAKLCLELLDSIKNHIEKNYILLNTNDSFNDYSLNLNRIFSRFHYITKQLRTRYANRNTLEVEDEYDVQDLLHALLRLYFDDIRPEEWTPSYAGGSSRMDFLLKNEQLVIEVKKIRKGLSDKELGEQLIIDIEKYKEHPDCKNLICFVYDPEGRLGNPTGIVNDLNKKHNGFVEVIISP